jgi:hypothetical protein
MLYALIGDSEMDKANLAFRDVDIYLHNRYTIWPGHTEKIKLGLNENVEIKFQMSVRKYLSVPTAPCTEETNYSLTGCLQDYVERAAGCRLDWFTDQLEGNYCEGPEAILKYKSALESIDFVDYVKVVQTTGE